MKLIIHPGSTRSTAALEFLITSRLEAMSLRRRIEEAAIRFNLLPEGSPRFQARIQLRVPGPDLHAEACDHTLRGAVHKALDTVEGQLDALEGRRRARRRSRLQLSCASRTGRAW